MENPQINEILISLREMLQELNSEELNMVEDFIVNQCGIENTDENDNYPNLFRMFITSPISLDFNEWVRFIDSESKEYP